MNTFIIVWVAALGAEAGTAETTGTALGPTIVIDEEGNVLRDGAPFRAVGINYFSAFSRRLKDPNDTSYREGLEALTKRGIPFVRFMACGFWPTDWKLYFEDKDRYFEYMDDVVRAAEEHTIGLAPSLFWYTATVPDMVGEPRNQWGNPESRTIAFMRRYTREVVTRYAHSSAVWAWEFGNEFSLSADLPNAADHRPWVYPNLGTPAARTPADDLSHDMVVTALREFAREVRRHDSLRPITTGNSLPRPAAHHMRTEGSWTQDTRDQFCGNLIDVTPDPHNLISVHMYPFDRRRRFDTPLISYEDILRLSMNTARTSGKGLFVGEFGAPDDEENGGPDRARREVFAQLTAIERSGVPLAALWNFDLPSQEDFINVSLTNHRSYLLDAIMHANRRLTLFRTGTHFAELASGKIEGRLLDNEANEDRQGSGFNPLLHADFPGENVFRGDGVGLNFEHIFNGVAADRNRSMFTPRKDPCAIDRISGAAATLRWPAEGSAWGMECEMRYAFNGEQCVDIEFRCTPTRADFPLGYVALMWASYMNHARDRKIHFYGRNGETEGWVTFGEDTSDGFETGTVSQFGTPDLPYEAGAETLNIIEHPAKKFLLPCYYGLLDGDGDPATEDDTMAYIMMFDQGTPIRFAMWNFIRNAAGEPDPHSPAWDWQFVIHNPQAGKSYGYRARVMIKPFVDAEDVRLEYDRWASRLYMRPTDG